MLIRFGVSNHLSIKERQELSFVPSRAIKDDDRGLIKCSAVPDGFLLPMLIIYGANASGKSNIVNSLRYVANFVRNSYVKNDPNARISRHGFAFCDELSGMPTEFDVDFVVGNVRYSYGFSVDDVRVRTEWLHSYPRGVRQLLFERDLSKFRFGRNLKGKNGTIAELTRDNCLFISSAAQLDHAEIRRIRDFLVSISGVGFGGNLVSIANEMFARREIDRRIVDFLTTINTGVVNVRKKEIGLPEGFAKFEAGIKDLAVRLLKASETGLKINANVIEFAHQGENGDEIYLPLNRESSGTQRLLIVLSSIFRAIDRGTVLCIDEIDASLHTQACEALLHLFYESAIGGGCAQLIATTHDTNLLGSRFLRRDQIWFTEKSNNGATTLYPLTDIRTRKGDDFEKGYLEGRYGGVPDSAFLRQILREV